MNPLRPVAYAGEPGAFAEDAVVAAFGDAAERVARPGFRDVFEAVESGVAPAGVVPIENLVNGSVREVQDLLLASNLEIAGEVVVPVRLCLAALPGQSLDDIERVYSHLQALGQAERFLRSRPWTLLSSYNTAGSGRLIRDAGEQRAGAILSPRAAEVHGLEILASEVQDVPDNRTRFLVLGRADTAHAVAAAVATEPRGAPRTTIVFGVRNEPGTLLRALRAFADRGINLSNLESRPGRAAAWEYVFWADLDAAADAPAANAALDDLRQVSMMVRVLGSYSRATA